MNGAIHFISGLPRSGSTLLASLLRQNPRVTSGMTSPVGHLVNAMLRETSMRHEDAVFIDDDLRKRLIMAMFDAYYADATPDSLIFDTNRAWTSKLHLLTRLFPKAKVIACVRSPALIVDSIETLIRANAFELSGIFGFEAGGTVYSRAEGLTGPGGMLGFAVNGLREAVYGPHADRLMLVRYESLIADPVGVLGRIYDFIGEPPAEHDPNDIPPSYDMVEFDRKLGTPGLHDVGRKIRPRGRKTVLPPDIFNRHDAGAFWNRPEELPDGLTVV